MSPVFDHIPSLAVQLSQPGQDVLERRHGPDLSRCGVCQHRQSLRVQLIDCSEVEAADLADGSAQTLDNPVVGGPVEYSTVGGAAE